MTYTRSISSRREDSYNYNNVLLTKLGAVCEYEWLSRRNMVMKLSARGYNTTRCPASYLSCVTIELLRRRSGISMTHYCGRTTPRFIRKPPHLCLVLHRLLDYSTIVAICLETSDLRIPDCVFSTASKSQ